MKSESLEGMSPGSSRDSALCVMEREAKQPYKTWWLTDSWWVPRREELRQLLSPRLTRQEALALSDLLFRRVSYDVVVAFLAEKRRAEWIAFSRAAQAALDEVRAAGGGKPLAGATLSKAGWFLRGVSRPRGDAAA